MAAGTAGDHVTLEAEEIEGVKATCNNTQKLHGAQFSESGDIDGIGGIDAGTDE